MVLMGLRKARHYMSKSQSEKADKIYECYCRGDWASARKLLLREIRRHPRNTWLLTRLSFVYFNEGKYTKALQMSEKAYTFDRHDPVVLWDYARALLETDRISESVRIFKTLIPMSVSTLAAKGYNRCWSRGIKNDCRFWIAVAYLRLDRLDLAAKYFRQHLANRKRGVPTECSIKEARNFLSGIEKLKEKIAKKDLRLWISLLEVKSLRGQEPARFTGAYTHGLVMAHSARQAESTLRKALARIGYEVVSVQDTEEFDRQCLKFEVEKDLRYLAAKVRRTRKTQFGAFYTWGAPKN
jgi:tetratricopeptide (TPR) repeat protein